MQAELNGATRPVLRYRRGVLWCPFCDRSTQDEGMDLWCDGCHAQFLDEAKEVTPTTPVRRSPGRSPRVVEAEPEEEVDLEAGDAVL